MDALLATSKITFDEPPVQEVALGRTFLQRPDFLVPYFGLFWERVREQFPTAEHAAPIVNPNIPPSELSMLPRVWLVAADSTTLLQLQQDRFHFNWRRTDNSDGPYVRFPVIQRQCIQLWNKFNEFVVEMTDQPLQPLDAELTYVNHIALPDVTDAFEIAARTLRDATWAGADRFLARPKGYLHQYTFDALPDGIGVLKVQAGSARRRDDGSDLLKLQLTVSGKCSDGASFEQWSTGARDFLVRAFKDLTTEAMHSHWRLRKE